ncbi:HGxxPAAW family protein [Streptomyces tricolor]
MSLYDEGHTIAGWTGFGIATVGSAVAGWGVCAVSPALIAGGLAVVVASVVVTWVLHLSGWGKPPGVRPRGQWGMRVRDAQAREGHTGCVSCRLAGRGRRRAVEPVAGTGVIPAEPIPLSPVE